MLYFANPVGHTAVKQAMSAGLLGFIDTPAQRNLRPEGVTWCADNGCFGAGSPGDIQYLAWLAKHQRDAPRCAFATAPDVIGDAAATLTRSLPFLPVIRALGYQVALVAQDGLETCVPWHAFDVLFIGGTPEWKLSAPTAKLVHTAKTEGKRVHMGRVNSRKRLHYAQAIGCDTVDGTFLTFGPDKNWPQLAGWLGLNDCTLSA